MNKEFSELPTGEIIYNGILYPGKTKRNEKVTFDSKKFFNHWENIIKKIEKEKFSYPQISVIYENFVHDMLSYGTLPQLLHKHQDVNHLRNKLSFSLEKAYSNYRETKSGFWGFVSGLFAHKTLEILPQLNLR